MHFLNERHAPSHVLLAAALALTCASMLRAQTLAPLPLGARLRVFTDTASPPLAGNLWEVAGDTLFLDTPYGFHGVLRPTVTHVDISRGYHRYWAESALVGGGIGAFLGFLAKRLANSGCHDSQERQCSTRPYVATGAVLFGLLSAVAGFSVRAERWRPLPAPLPTSPSDAGLGPRVSD
jgi:hypothetical protein